MDDNSVSKWIVPAMGALTALYFYKNSCDVVKSDTVKVSDNSTNCTDTNANEITDNKCDEISKANELLKGDAQDADILSIINTKETATHISESFIKSIEENEKGDLEEKVVDDYETVTKSSLQNIKSTDVSQKSRWWY